MQDLYQKTLEKSEPVDKEFLALSDEGLYSYRIEFQVPTFHPRAKELKTYKLITKTLTARDFESKGSIYLIDEGIVEIPFIKELLPTEHVFIEQPQEDTFKEYGWLNEYIDDNDIKNIQFHNTVAVGGGLTANVAAYIAEMFHTSLTVMPSTVIGMCDISGGKVRVNKIDRKRSIKHYYKSFYEPNKILVDSRFLDTLKKWHISTGLGEIIKHGVFQSHALFKYLISEKFNPVIDKTSLLRAILWAAALKEVCLRIDVEENENGSRRILRGGHEFSDRIEEDTNFEIPHGTAVSIGVYRELELQNSTLLADIEKLYERFNIPKSVEEFYEIQKS